VALKGVSGAGLSTAVLPVASGFVLHVDYGGDRRLPLVANPVQFDRKPPHLRPAPGFAAHTDEVLSDLGMDESQIIDAKISGGVV